MRCKYSHKSRSKADRVVYHHPGIEKIALQLNLRCSDFGVGFYHFVSTNDNLEMSPGLFNDRALEYD